VKNGVPRLALPAAVVSAAIVVGASLLLGRAGAAPTTASSHRTGVVVVTTNLLGDNSAAGTGVVLTSSGRVLTNNHVIRGASSIRVTDPSDGLSFSAKVLGYSVSKDVALLQLQKPRNLKPARIGNSSSARVGQRVLAVGNAGGTGNLTTVTGRVTGIGRSIDVSDGEGSSNRLIGLIKTDAPLQPGDSGGPLLENGRVIGIDVAAGSRGGFNSSFTEGYAIPINRATSIVRQIQAGRRSATLHVGPTAFLGVSVANGDGGAAIAQLVNNGPAEKAGLQEGDVITAVNGRSVRSATSLTTVMLSLKPGAKVSVTFLDQTGSQSVSVTLGSGPPQ